MLEEDEYCAICGVPVGVTINTIVVRGWTTLPPNWALEEPNWCNEYRAVIRECSKHAAHQYLAPYVSDLSKTYRPELGRFAVATRRPSTHHLHSLMEVTKRKFELAQNEIKYRVPLRDVENDWPIFAAFGLSCHSFCWNQLERLMPDLSWSFNSEGLLRLWHTLLSQDRDLGGARLFHGPLTQWTVCCQELPDPSVYFAEPALPVNAETKQTHWALLTSTRPFVPPEISHMIATFLDFQDLQALYDAHALPIPEYMLRDRSLQFWEEYADMNAFQARKAELREMERRREERAFTRVIRLEDPELCQEDIDEMDEEELEDEAEKIAMEIEDQYAFYPPKAVLNYYRIDNIVKDIARRCDELGGDADLNLLLPVGFEDPWP